MGGALGYNHILVMLLREDMAENFHYTYTIYSTQYWRVWCAQVGRTYNSNKTKYTYCLRQWTRMSLNSPVVNIPTTILFVIKNAAY